MLNDPRPFIIATGQQSGGERSTSIGQPMGTTVSKAEHCLSSPTLMPINHGGDDERVRRGDRPHPTLTKSRGEYAMAAYLARVGNGERDGQEARTRDARAPYSTTVASGGGGKDRLVGTVLKFFGGVVGNRPDRPLGAVTGTDHNAAMATYLVKFRGACTSAPVDGPGPTFTGGGEHVGVGAASLVKFYCDPVTQQQSLRVPIHTIPAHERFGLLHSVLTPAGETFDLARAMEVGALVLEHAKPGEEIKGLAVVCAEPGALELMHAAGAAWAVEAPVLGVICTVEVDGWVYVVADVGLRMLAVEELARCQGFPEDYVLPRVKSQAVRLIGNSVCPPVARAIVRANCGHLVRKRRRAA